jgi:hypothetical protein
MTETSRFWVEASAIVLGPIIALSLQRWLDRLRENKKAKLTTFYTLMANRANFLNPSFVQALNSIDVDFHSRKDSNIRAAWETLLDHLINIDQASVGAEERRKVLMADLLTAMGKRLGYNFTEVYIKRNAYYPKGQANLFSNELAVKEELLKILRGKSSLPVSVRGNSQPDKDDFPTLLS